MRSETTNKEGKRTVREPSSGLDKPEIIISGSE
jgi:hypothetical protein